MRTAEGTGSETTLGQQAPLCVYRLVISHPVGQQLCDAPPILQGQFAGITAILRIDPTAASIVLQIQRTDNDVWTAAYGEGQGFLRYQVVEAQHLVVLLDLVWIG
jgi:hypothetical protein